MKMTYIDNGVYVISQKDAKTLSNTLPKQGNEILVKYNDKHYWLTKQPINNNPQWTLRDTNWRFNELGQPVLSIYGKDFS